MLIIVINNLLYNFKPLHNCYKHFNRFLQGYSTSLKVHRRMTNRVPARTTWGVKRLSWSSFLNFLCWKLVRHHYFLLHIIFASYRGRQGIAGVQNCDMHATVAVAEWKVSHAPYKVNTAWPPMTKNGFNLHRNHKLPEFKVVYPHANYKIHQGYPLWHILLKRFSSLEIW